MKRNILHLASLRLSSHMETVAGSILLLMMVLTVVDIIGRLFGFPVLGTYEIVSLAGGFVLAFVTPATSTKKAHATVDLILEQASDGTRNLFHILTRLIAISLFLIIGWSFFKLGSHLFEVAQVTPILRLPFYPVVFAMGFAFLIECLALIYDMCNLPKSRG